MRCSNESRSKCSLCLVADHSAEWSRSQSFDPLGKNTWRCSGLITSVRRPRRLDQQNVYLAVGHGAMLDAFRHDEHFAWVERDRAIPQFDFEGAPFSEVRSSPR